MNTYIMNALKRFRNILSSNEVPSSESVDSIIGELEMMKMEIEQHIKNMPRTKEYENLFLSAQKAVNNLKIILELLEEFSPTEKDGQPELLEEIFVLIDDINY